MSNYVVIVALILSGTSFLVYLLIALAGARAKLGKDAHAAAGAALQKAQAVSPAELTDLLKALTEFSDSLAKAGPALTSIMASILFLAIAAIGTGAPFGDHGPSDHKIQQTAPEPR